MPHLPPRPLSCLCLPAVLTPPLEASQPPLAWPPNSSSHLMTIMAILQMWRHLRPLKWQSQGRLAKCTDEPCNKSAQETSLMWALLMILQHWMQMHSAERLNPWNWSMYEDSNCKSFPLEGLLQYLIYIAVSRHDMWGTNGLRYHWTTHIFGSAAQKGHCIKWLCIATELYGFRAL